MMELIIQPSGDGYCLYDEAIPLHRIGQLQIRRASHVEPTPGGRWVADLTPVAGPLLGPFTSRSEALQAELHWLRQHWAPGRS